MQVQVILSFLFFFSGCAALIYQVIWQRMLFTIFGVNLESVTIIVSVFMFGLGVGAQLNPVIQRIFDSVSRDAGVITDRNLLTEYKLGRRLIQ